MRSKKAPIAPVAARRPVHGDARGAADQRTRSPGFQALREGSLATSERGARLDASDQCPQPVGGGNVVERQRQRSTQCPGRNGADEHEVAE